MPKTDQEIKKFFDKYRSLLKSRLFLIKVRNKLVRLFPIKNIPFIRILTKRCVKHIQKYQRNNSTKNMVIDVCRVYSKSIFDGAVDVEFEGKKFLAPIGWDEFLRTRYGDYMELPPENQRHPYHVGNYFWK